MPEHKHFETLLRGRLVELEARLHAVEAELDQPADPDFEDRATEREGDEVLEGLGSAGLSEIAKINAALERIDKGEYGVCVECGETISVERLEAIPHTPRCKSCA